MVYVKLVPVMYDAEESGPYDMSNAEIAGTGKTDAECLNAFVAAIDNGKVDVYNNTLVVVRD